MRKIFKLFVFSCLLLLGCSNSDSETNKDTVIGYAANAKGGAVIVDISNNVYYIKDLSSWDIDLVSKELVVTGTIIEEALIPEAKKSNGSVSQGAKGLQKVISHAKWKLKE